VRERVRALPHALVAPLREAALDEVPALAVGAAAARRRIAAAGGRRRRRRGRVRLARRVDERVRRPAEVQREERQEVVLPVLSAE